MSEWLLDGALATLLLVLAMAVIRAPGLYASIILFIAFGLLLALTWARLGAPDLALAEAAIGAGLTGVLLLNALAHARPERPSKTLYAHRWPALLLSLALVALLIRAVWPLGTLTQPLPAEVMNELAASGVDHPVTAVLLNFRAWDTLLELLVVLFAFLGLRQLRLAPVVVSPAWPLLAAWGRLLAPLALVIGGYLLWRGTSAPGGAFQGGALLAAGLVVLRLDGALPLLSWRQWPVRLGVLLGVGVFVLVAALTHGLGEGWLHYPAAWNKPLIILIEVAATLSIALTLALLVVGEPEEVHP